MTVAEGQTTATFKVRAYDVAPPATATNTAETNNLAKTLKLTVNEEAAGGLKSRSGL